MLFRERNLHSIVGGEISVFRGFVGVLSKNTTRNEEENQEGNAAIYETAFFIMHARFHFI